jgi:hypothetical protein
MSKLTSFSLTGGIADDAAIFDFLPSLLPRCLILAWIPSSKGHAGCGLRLAYLRVVEGQQQNIFALVLRGVADATCTRQRMVTCHCHWMPPAATDVIDSARLWRALSHLL